MQELVNTSQLERQLRSLAAPYVVMAVGIPGSGKTTVLKTLAAGLNVTYISPDEIREEVTGSQHDQSANSRIWAITYRRVKTALQSGVSVIIDATHTSHRASAIRQYRSCGAAKVIAVIFATSLEIAKQRNAARQRKVDEAVLERMGTALVKEPPNRTEGFDEVFHYKSSPQDFSQGSQS